jgi:phosphatidylglycerophosphate synthase
MLQFINVYLSISFLLLNYQNQAVAVNNLGKWKTATQMTALTIMLLVRDPRL